MNKKTNDCAIVETKKDRKILDTLIRLVELYIETNKPVGSKLLQKIYFEHISSATLRNYFSDLDKNGYLKKVHTSGGRIPTDKAFRIYCDFNTSDYTFTDHDACYFNIVRSIPIQHNIIPLLEKHIQCFSNHINHMTFLSSPSFESDTISDLKLIYHNTQKCIALITSFYGFIQCEEIILPSNCDKETLDKISESIQMKLYKSDTDNIVEYDSYQEIVDILYQEIILRFVTKNIATQHSKLIHSGINNLIKHSEFNQVKTISEILTIFNEEKQLKKILNNENYNKTNVLIGNELSSHIPQLNGCTLYWYPITIKNIVVSHMGCISPIRSKYNKIIPILKEHAEILSELLTQIYFTYKLDIKQTKQQRIT